MYLPIIRARWHIWLSLSICWISPQAGLLSWRIWPMAMIDGYSLITFLIFWWTLSLDVSYRPQSLKEWNSFSNLWALRVLLHQRQVRSHNLTLRGAQASCLKLANCEKSYNLVQLLLLVKVDMNRANGEIFVGSEGPVCWLRTQPSFHIISSGNFIKQKSLGQVMV